MRIYGATFIFGAMLASASCSNTTIVAEEIRESASSEERETASATESAEDTATETAEDTATETAEDTATDTDTGCGVPTSFRWTSSGPLIAPPEGVDSIKDPSVLFYNGRWHIYATTHTVDFSMTYLSFEDWDQAGEAPKTPVSDNPNLEGYKAAPQLFLFSPQNRWYLVYQTQEPAYSTTDDPTDVGSWSGMTLFMPRPDIIENSDTGGIDYWVICDDTDCYLFFTALNGVLYRARTARAVFPDGFEGSTEIALEDDNHFDLFQGCNVYNMEGTGQYLLLIEALGENGRYYRSWTSDRLDGDWAPLADTEDDPFASMSNVTGAEWSLDGISQGEMLRTNPDETLTINTCDMRFLYQGVTEAGADYGSYKFSLGLLTDAR